MKYGITLLVLIVFFMLGYLIGLLIYSTPSQSEIDETPEISSQYQGPVPEGYDEDHFRETGETIPIIKDG